MINRDERNAGGAGVVALALVAPVVDLAAQLWRHDPGELVFDVIDPDGRQAISGAESFGKSLGDRICKGGGVPRGPLIDCADCIRLFPEYETQEACFKGCRETIEKCTRTPGPRSECPVPAQS